MTITKGQLKKAEVEARKGERARQKHSKFMSRTLSIYRNQQARLRKESQQEDVSLPYSLEDFRTWFQAGLDSGCAYTGERLTIRRAAVDHKRPIARGGSWQLDNLCVCHESTNWQKGALDSVTFMQLLVFCGKLDPDSATDIKRRLSAGGKALKRF